MDAAAAARARDRSGVVVRADLGTQPVRAAHRAGLREVHRGAYVAVTQPIGLEVHLSVLREVWGDREVFVTGQAALWLHGAAERPTELVVAVRQGGELAAKAPLTVRRLADAVLAGSRTRHGIRVVALEVAVIQVATTLDDERTVELVEELVRSRRTTLVRLRARCRRGFAGSARVRRACDLLTGGSMDRDVRRLHQALRARGVTGLVTEFRFVNKDGASAYADLFDVETRTAIEVDGRLTHTTREQFRADRRRDRWLRKEHGITTLRVDVSEIRDDLDALADELAELLASLARDPLGDAPLPAGA